MRIYFCLKQMAKNERIYNILVIILCYKKYVNRKESVFIGDIKWKKVRISIVLWMSDRLCTYFSTKIDVSDDVFAVKVIFFRFNDLGHFIGIIRHSKQEFVWISGIFANIHYGGADSHWLLTNNFIQIEELFVKNSYMKWATLVLRPWSNCGLMFGKQLWDYHLIIIS